MTLLDIVGIFFWMTLVGLVAALLVEQFIGRK